MKKTVGLCIAISLSMQAAERILIMPSRQTLLRRIEIADNNIVQHDVDNPFGLSFARLQERYHIVERFEGQYLFPQALMGMIGDVLVADAYYRSAVSALANERQEPLIQAAVDVAVAEIPYVYQVLFPEYRRLLLGLDPIEE